MARDEHPPFERGQTYYGGTAIDSANYGGVNYEGMEYTFEDLDYSVTGAKPKRSGKKVVCRVVRNVSAAAILPKRLAKFSLDAFYGLRVDGMVNTTAGEGFPVDEWLPAAGVPVGDLFFLVVRGPATILTDIAASANNVHVIGTPVVGLLAATSGATTAGRGAPQDLTGATAVLGNQLQNRIGAALSARTTANTNSDLLVDVYAKW